jgi:hypothetical protein
MRDESSDLWGAMIVRDAALKAEAVSKHLRDRLRAGRAPASGSPVPVASVACALSLALVMLLILMGATADATAKPGSGALPMGGVAYVGTYDGGPFALLLSPHRFYLPYIVRDRG